eukprot:TRINITY_DN201_c0_g1_i1.p1 TRINITY_DN201_c0_g1~~TRINITY_DN201_c0_g1_i1.p1  ORF type:complete len:342 (+),score=104.10 TRINITY_DN201_c0_g1_i1:193-1218(+)
MSWKIFLVLLGLVLLGNCADSPVDSNTETEAHEDENEDSAHEEEEREYKFETESDGKGIVVEAKSRTDSQNELKFSIRGGSEGGKIRAESKTKSSGSRAKYEFRLFIKRLVIYTDSNNNGVYDKGTDAVVATYPSTSNWSWKNIASDASSTPVTYTLVDTNDIVSIVVKLNFPANQNMDVYSISLNDIKFDIKIDYNRLATFTSADVTANNVAIVGVIQSTLKARSCTAATASSTETLCVNDNSNGAIGGFLKWVNNVDCVSNNNSTVVKKLRSSPVVVDNTERLAVDSDGTDSANVIVWNIEKGASGVCVWDPQLRVTGASSSVVASLVVLAAFVVALVV